MKIRTKVLAALMVMLIVLASVASTNVFAREATYTITVDMEGHCENMVIENVEADTYLSNVLYEAFNSFNPLVDGFFATCFTLEPTSEFESLEEAYESTQILNNTIVTSDMTIYICWLELINEVRINVEAPKCGMETEISEGDGNPYEMQTNRPVVTFEEPENFETEISTCWLVLNENNNNWEPYAGTFEYGNEYMAGIDYITPKFPYAFNVFSRNNRTKFFINNTLVENERNFGFYDITTAFAIGALTCEHDWGDWEVVKEPTTTEEGTERRTCAGDPTHTEERAIPKLDEPDPDPEPEPIDEPVIYYFDVDSSDASAAQNTYTADSGVNLPFKVECDTVNDIISRFLGIKVDGKPVDKANYDATAGSVDISLHADYLDTLSEGEHTLTALFDDGEVETTFTILPDDSEPVDDTPEVATPAEPTGVSTGDNSSRALFSILMAICFAVMCMAVLIKGKKYEAKYFAR